MTCSGPGPPVPARHRLPAAVRSHQVTQRVVGLESSTWFVRPRSSTQGGDRGSPVMRPPPSVEDRRLRQRLVARELDALGEVYDRYVAVVYGVAMTVTAERDAADGVTQETFLDLWRQPERFDPSRGPLRPWLAMAAHRRAVETVRDRIAGQGPDQQLAIPVDRVLDIDEIAQSVLSTEEVRTALGGL